MHRSHPRVPPPADHPPLRVPIVLTTAYTAPCRRCGRRLHLSEDEMLASLTTPPACWLCDD